ncbi:hypothetical protein, partial [Candidatus Cardinium sp. cBcalN1]|uniref:hypothetical protein n=1 Tax=Candidatus Cardinium sp. cBcalN1 TaxID=2699437 RepID=UPI001FB4E515
LSYFFFIRKWTKNQTRCKKLGKARVTTGKTESTLQLPWQLFFFASVMLCFLAATILQGAFFGCTSATVANRYQKSPLQLQ